MTRLLLAVLLVASPRVAVQELLNLEGTWRGSCADCAPNAMPAGFSRTLVIRVSPSEIAIRNDGFPADVYRLDGTETALADGRTATASVEAGTVVLTTVRTRARSRDDVYQTLMRQVYRVSGNTLTVERSARGIHPNEPPSERWVRIGTVMYQRD